MEFGARSKALEAATVAEAEVSRKRNNNKKGMSELNCRQFFSRR